MNNYVLVNVVIREYWQEREIKYDYAALVYLDIGILYHFPFKFCICIFYYKTQVYKSFPFAIPSERTNLAVCIEIQ